MTTWIILAAGCIAGTVGGLVNALLTNGGVRGWASIAWVVRKVLKQGVIKYHYGVFCIKR